jgi:hypothetical protein
MRAQLSLMIVTHKIAEAHRRSASERTAADARQVSRLSEKTRAS